MKQLDEKTQEQSLSQKLCELREGTGLGIAGLAKEIGVSVSAISAIETGEHPPSGETLARYNSYFGTDLKRIGICANCGRRFEYVKKKVKYCPKCKKNSIYTPGGKPILKTRRRKKLKPLDELLLELRAKGMDYGEAQREATKAGITVDEYLKAAGDLV